MVTVWQLRCWFKLPLIRKFNLFIKHTFSIGHTSYSFLFLVYTNICYWIVLVLNSAKVYKLYLSWTSTLRSVFFRTLGDQRTKNQAYTLYWSSLLVRSYWFVLTFFSSGYFACLLIYEPPFFSWYLTDQSCPVSTQFLPSCYFENILLICNPCFLDTSLNIVVLYIYDMFTFLDDLIVSCRYIFCNLSCLFFFAMFHVYLFAWFDILQPRNNNFPPKRFTILIV